MTPPNILSGFELVKRGVTKSDASLPELGIKYVVPSGSWLEQKQVQVALEARKHLIEVERIEKSGNLSHAEWREELMLAEVTQKVGGYWQYIGHNIGKQLFLYPEEALFLMEVNNLQLKHGDVKVSLQQAYSLLLRGKISNAHYKVYASLSRIGYKVFRHKELKLTEYEKKINLTPLKKYLIGDKSIVPQNTDSITNADESDVNKNKESMDVSDNDLSESINNTNSIRQPDSAYGPDNLDTNLTDGKKSHDENNKMQESNNTNDYLHNCLLYNANKLQKLKNRKFRPCNKSNIFKDFPNICQNMEICIKSPEGIYVPSNIALSKSEYELNLNRLSTKNNRTVSDSDSYSVTDEAHGAHMSRIRNQPAESQQYLKFYRYNFFNEFNIRSFNNWAPRANVFNFNMFYQRPFLHNMHFRQNYQFYSRMPPALSDRFYGYYTKCRVNNDIVNAQDGRRENCNAKKHHLNCIKRLAARLKDLILSGNNNNQNVKSLKMIIQTFNNKYNARLRVTNDFLIVNEDNVLETIDLDDDEEPTSKKPRIDSENSFQENLNKMKDLAIQFKNLENKHDCSSRHRRAFSNLLKTFNKSYKVEYYINDQFEVLDRNHITLDSSSDSDCVIEKTAPKKLKRKKLRNPFNVLKRLSEVQNTTLAEASTSKDEMKIDSVTVSSEKNSKHYDEVTLKTFNENWLPNEDDFGRAEVIRNVTGDDYMDSRKGEFLYDFMKIQSCKYNNWLDAKIAFLTTLQETAAVFQKESDVTMDTDCLVKPEDYKDMATVLQKLRIISTNKNVNEKSNLAFDFDVYNRDVQKFKKSNRSTPHFRVICVDESSGLPSGIDVATIHSQNEDASILFAVVGSDTISFLQINPTDLPVYIASSHVGSVY